MRVQWQPRLHAGQAVAVAALVADAADVDGVPPLSEHVLLHLAHGGDPRSRNLLAFDDTDAVVGYAHLDITDTVAGASAELTVLPAMRGKGVGGELVKTLLDASPDGRLRLWAHGQHPAAEAMAHRWGFQRVRVLWQMRRSLYAPLPEPSYPPDIELRTFVKGQDEPEWTAVNNRAFDDHPDQGRWTAADISVREAEPWFDPAGFFLATRGGAIVGFHWTKVHGGLAHGGHEHDAIGEVYVVGVDPSAQRLGLGPALTLTGLRYLRARGLGQVMLYVDEDNTNAIGVYERLGFTRWDTDVTYARG